MPSSAESQTKATLLDIADIRSRAETQRKFWSTELVGMKPEDSRQVTALKAHAEEIIALCDEIERLKKAIDVFLSFDYVTPSYDDDEAREAYETAIDDAKGDLLYALRYGMIKADPNA